MTNTNTTKVTKKDMFKDLLLLVNEADIEAEDKEKLVEFISHEIDLLNNKAKKTNDKVTATNQAIAKTILTVLEEHRGEKLRIGDMLDDERLKSYEEETKDDIKVIRMSSQKLSSVLSKLVDAGQVIRDCDKKKTPFFSIA